MAGCYDLAYEFDAPQYVDFRTVGEPDEDIDSWFGEFLSVVLFLTS